MSLLMLRVNSRTTGASGTGPNGTSNCALWVTSDPINPSTPAYSLDGSNRVQTLFDLSGSGNHLTQTMPTWRPLLVLNGITCNTIMRDRMQFDGIDDRLFNNMISIEDTPNSKVSYAMYVVFRGNNQVDKTLLSIPHVEPGPTPTDGISLGLSSMQLKGEITTFIPQCPGVPITLPTTSIFTYADGKTHSLALLYDGTLLSGQVKLYIDNVLTSSLSFPTPFIVAESATFNLGAFGAGGGNFGGDIFEAVIFRAASDSTRAVVHNYFLQRWCIGM